MRALWIHVAAIVTILSVVAGCVAATPAQPLPEARPVATEAPPTAASSTAAPPTAASAPPTEAPALTTPVPALMDVIKSYEAAVNRDDASGFPALFPERFDSSWQWSQTAASQQQLADVTAFLAAMHDGVHLTECSQSGANQAKCRATHSDDCLKTAGVPSLEVSLGFTIVDGKIKVLSYGLPESSKADDSKANRFQADVANWVRRERPDLRDKLFNSMGDYITSSEAGATWSQACQEYAATLK